MLQALHVLQCIHSMFTAIPKAIMCTAVLYDQFKQFSRISNAHDDVSDATSNDTAIHQYILNHLSMS